MMRQLEREAPSRSQRMAGSEARSQSMTVVRPAMAGLSGLSLTADGRNRRAPLGTTREWTDWIGLMTEKAKEQHA